MLFFTRTWSTVFTGIHKALTSDDNSLWSDYRDDLQRLLWFIISQGRGEEYIAWMDEHDDSIRFGSLRCAVLGATRGADELLRINPETRELAQVIYDDLKHLLALYHAAS